MKTVYLLLIVFFNTISILPQGLVAYYPLDGNSNDYSGNSNNGTIIGGVTPTTDRFDNSNSAMQFNGVDGYIEIPSSASLESPASGLTITAWMYLDDFPSNQVAVAGIVNKTNSPDYGQYCLSYQAWSTPVIAYNQNGGSQGFVANIDALDFSTWYFIALTYDGNTVTIYLNGTMVGSSTIPGPIQADSNPLTIGLETPGDTEYLHGKLDEIRIYNRALSEQEILGLTDIEDNQHINSKPTDFVLEQNYPNPFNPSTVISYMVPNTSRVSITVYDILGNRITELINSTQNAGVYNIEFNATDLPSGVYIYTINTEQFRQSKKMLLLK